VFSRLQVREGERVPRTAVLVGRAPDGPARQVITRMPLVWVSTARWSAAGYSSWGPYQFWCALRIRLCSVDAQAGVAGVPQCLPAPGSDDQRAQRVPGPADRWVQLAVDVHPPSSRRRRRLLSGFQGTHHAPSQLVDDPVIEMG
jgi:hypothetical protein